MRHLGTLERTGAVRLGDEPIGTVDYAINFYATPHLKDGQGTIEGGSAVLYKIMNAGVAATLELEGGDTVDFLISNWNIHEDRADIATTGPIPGF